MPIVCIGPEAFVDFWGSHKGAAMSKSKRGFASMDPEKVSEIASKGGKVVSQDREHMAEIGRKGGMSKAKRAAE